MYKIPIITASSVFVIATATELIAVETLRGSLVEWLTQPHKLPLLLVLIATNAMQGALFGYAAHSRPLLIAAGNLGHSFAYLPISFSSGCAASGAATLPSKMSFRLTSAP